MLKLADNLSLPLDALTETVGVLARRGAGKTYTASVLVEEFVKAGAPVVALDPTGVWWGLRSSADGEAPGLPVTILGGEHGDLPLDVESGRVIAEMVVSDPRPLVLDLSGFESNAAQDRFVADFAESLYRLKAKKRDALHLVFDEADSFAPQRPMPGQARMLGAIEALVRRGRSRGLGCTFITQRPAVLNKNVLSQVELMFVLQLTAPQDRSAVDDWISGHATPAQCKELLGSLASLQKGEAWVYSPSRFEIFRRVQIRKRETFNSSDTPKVGEHLVEPQNLAPVDLDALRELMAASIEARRNEDPALLREQIAELKKELKKRPTETVEVEKIVHVVPPESVELGLTLADSLIAQAKDLYSLGTQIHADLAPFRDQEAPHAQLNLPGIAEANEPEKEPKTDQSTIKRSTTKFAPKSVKNAPTGKTKLAPAQQRILDVLAELDALGMQRVDRGNLATWSGLSPKSSTYRAHLTTLKNANLIDYYSQGRTGLTPGGINQAQPAKAIKSRAALLDAWGRFLTTTQSEILQFIAVNYPKVLARSFVAGATGQSVTSGAFREHLTRLRAFGLVDYPDAQSVVATALLFPPGLK